MKSFHYDLAKPQGEFRYYQIDVQWLLKEIRSQVGYLVTGSITGKSVTEHYDEVALGVLQKAIDECLVFNRGFELEESPNVFPRRQADKYLLPDDRNELVIDAVAHLSRLITLPSPYTAFSHPVVYRVLPNGNLLVGIDKRDLL